MSRRGGCGERDRGDDDVSAATSTDWNAGNQLFGFDGEGYL